MPAAVVAPVHALVIKGTFEADRVVSVVLNPTWVGPLWNIVQSPAEPHPNPQLADTGAANGATNGATATSRRPESKSEAGSRLAHRARDRPRRPAWRSSEPLATDPSVRATTDIIDFTEYAPIQI